VETKNEAESLLISTERSLNEHKSKIGADDIKAIEGALEATRKALAGSDNDAIKKSLTELQNAAMRIGTAMYKNTGSASAGAGSGSGSGSSESGEKKADEQDINAEFKDKK
jgi:molecular chaperone DnaK